MTVLAVICIDGDSALFKTNNKKLIDAAGKNSRIKVLCYTEKEYPDTTPYERYLEALGTTDSKYFAFVDDAIRFQTAGLEGMLRHIDEEDNDYYSVKVRESDDTTIERILDTRFPLLFSRYIFKKEFLSGINIDKENSQYFRELIILEAAASEKFRLLDYKVDCLEDDRLETKSARYSKAFEKEWYIPAVRDFIIPQLKERSSSEEQTVLLYMLFRKHWSNRSIYDKKLLDESELIEFENLTDKALAMIDEDVFFSEYAVRVLSLKYCIEFFRKANDRDVYLDAEPDGKETRYSINGHFVGTDLIEAHIYAINIEDDELHMDFLIRNDFFGLCRSGSVKVDSGGRSYAPSASGIANTIKLFNEEVVKNDFYKTGITLKDTGRQVIRFFADINGVTIQLPLAFKKTASRLTRESDHSYCILNGYRLKYKDDTISVSDKNRVSFDEPGFEKDIFRIRRSKKNAIAALGLRRLYKAGLYKPKKKPVWIFFDKIYKGGDNGEHLFRYAYDNVGYADSYYIIRDDAESYKDLVAQYGDHILPYNKLRQKLMVLYADIIFATHASVFKFCGFGPTLQACFRGELKAKVVCIQHGLTIQDIPQFQNRLVDNTRAYFCAAQMEIDNLSQDMYGYDPSELFLTGLPRYDGLYSDDKKQILITPTWRREIVISGNKTGDSKEYNPRFKDTVYYKVYNDLIHNEKLNKCARENGYRIIYLLHPTLGAQMKDFKETDMVRVVNGAEALYETYLSESSLMITDYSGVQFDFAYMKKPVIYYHPEELPPHYENSHFSYEDDGFGPIINRQEELVDSVCEYMKNGCVMEKQYIDRVMDFFAYTDHDNCKRICDTIKEVFYPEEVR